MEISSPLSAKCRSDSRCALKVSPAGKTFLLGIGCFIPKGVSPRNQCGTSQSGSREILLRLSINFHLQPVGPFVASRSDAPSALSASLAATVPPSCSVCPAACDSSHVMSAPSFSTMAMKPGDRDRASSNTFESKRPTVCQPGSLATALRGSLMPPTQLPFLPSLFPAVKRRDPPAPLSLACSEIFRPLPS